MQCFSCQTAKLLTGGDRIGFRDTCDVCHADLHVCRNCAFYDAGAYNECREPQAERVLDKERANRCDCFAPTNKNRASAAADKAKHHAALDALFKK